MEERKKTEADFHDQRSRDKESDNQAEFEKKYPNKKLYCITKEHRKRIDSWIQSNSGKSKIALDYCCGEGEGAIKLAKAGAITFGIDISGDSLLVQIFFGFVLGLSGVVIRMRKLFFSLTRSTSSCSSCL